MFRTESIEFVVRTGFTSSTPESYVDDARAHDAGHCVHRIQDPR
jgi:hypothetical protein